MIKHFEIIQQIHKLFNKLLFLEKKKILSLNGIKLFPSEIHFIIMIKESHSTNATRMAEAFGVTKGAISQIVSRLEKKGLIIKTKDSQNKNEMTINFTSIGEVVSTKLMDLKSKLNGNYENILSTYAEDECKLISKFLIKLEEVISRAE